MAEADDSQKTEEPTSKKIQKAREKGQVAQSQELKSWAILLAAATALLLMAPGIMSGVRATGKWVLESAHAITVEKYELQLLFYQLILEVAKIIGPLIVVLVIVALAIGGSQTGLLVATAKIKPELKKISLIKGFKSKFSMKQLVEFIKSLLKLVLVAGVALGLAVPLMGNIETVPMMSLILTLHELHLVALWLVAGTVAVMTVVAVIDYIFQKYTYIKGLRMTKQEVKDEYKQSEGDPQIKAQIRRVRTERARARMIAAVPQANVVITNPTHYAVALMYKMEEMRAPRVVAKGLDLVAQRIRQVADENDVPIVENPPLARALYAAVELDEEIPPEHFKAVAEVIGYVMRLRGELPSAAAG